MVEATVVVEVHPIAEKQVDMDMVPVMVVQDLEATVMAARAAAAAMTAAVKVPAMVATAANLAGADKLPRKLETNQKREVATWVDLGAQIGVCEPATSARARGGTGSRLH